MKKNRKYEKINSMMSLLQNKKMHAILQSSCSIFYKRFLLILSILIFIGKSSFAQKITAGPIVGAVTDSSAKFLFFTDAPSDGYIKISTEPILLKNGSINSAVNSSNSLLITFSARDSTNNGNVFYFDFLQPNTKYFYLLSYGNDNKTGSFTTFTSLKDTTHFSFTLGSCTEQHHNDSIFVEMQKHQPAFFLHLGDWLYPDNFNEDKFFYDESLERQKELYQKRYEMPNLKTFLSTTPIDFVFDDEDGVYDDFSKTSYTAIKMNGKETSINEVSYADSLRLIAIDGYKQFFPNYDEIAHQAYHSFVYGNAAFFFLDTRSTRSPNSEIFQQRKNGKWKFKAPKHHNILDTAQMNWLLTNLKNSSAEWKFIVSGVTFNQSYKKVFDICMRVQKRILPNGMNGAYVAASLASMWFAFPESQTQLLNFCHDNKIKNVIVLSGDAHTAAIDDGKNAGFPELMAGGLAQKNSKLAAIIKNNLRLNLWNQGGQGIGNSNFNDAFGNVEVNGNSSVRLSCIDKYGKEICAYEVKNGFIPKHYNLKPRLRIKRLRALKNLFRIAVHQ